METQTVTPAKYVRKPLYVDALQVTEANFADAARFCFGTVCNIDESTVDPAAAVQPTKQYIHVRVHNPKNPRQTKAFVGDWILYTERGYKVYTTKAFQANFDRVDGEGFVVEPNDPDDDGRTRVDDPDFGDILDDLSEENAA